MVVLLLLTIEQQQYRILDRIILPNNDELNALQLKLKKKDYNFTELCFVDIN